MAANPPPVTDLGQLRTMAPLGLLDGFDADRFSKAQAAEIEAGLAERLDVKRRLVPVADTRALTKADMPNNDALPRIEVEPDTFTVRVDGEVVEAAPAAELPMAQRYFLF